MKRRLYYLTMFVGLAFLAYSCSNDDDQTPTTPEPATKNIVETAQDTDVLNVLVQALMKADELGSSDLIGTLSGNGPFTVFAPTNDAFTELLADLENYDSLDDFVTDEDKMVLATILQYHVIAGVGAKSTDLTDGQVLGTVQGEDVTVTLNNGVFISDATMVDAEVVVADVEASNGIVHVIDKVLLPQAIIDALNAEEMGNLVDVVVGAETLSVLEAAVIKAGLVDTLASEGPFTVFAPDDNAFLALLDVLGDDYNSLDDFDTEEEIALLKDILLYHVIAGSVVLSTDLSEGEVPTALVDNSIEIIASEGTFVIGDASQVNANITGVDIMASNGVAHTISKVLLPQSAIDFVASLSAKNIVELALETEELSSLVAALQQADAGLVDLLQQDGPFTVFAPTNQAFQDLLDALGNDYNSLADFDTEEEKANLANILQYHVFSGAGVFSTDLSNNQTITMAQGEAVTVLLENNGVFIQDTQANKAQVVIADQEATNGVVHIIDRVILPGH